jgi:hypothetical protein
MGSDVSCRIVEYVALSGAYLCLRMRLQGSRYIESGDAKVGARGGVMREERGE